MINRALSTTATHVCGALVTLMLGMSIYAGELFFKNGISHTSANGSVKVIAQQSHSFNTFTQGYQYHKNFFYESSGGYGKSFVIKYDKKNIELARFIMPYSLFAEGLTIQNNEVIVLSWKSGLVHYLDAKDLSLKRKKRIIGEGWGLASDGKHLYLSDGTNELRVYDPKTMVQKDTVALTFDDKPVKNLNELEICDKKLYANIWGTAKILVVDLGTFKPVSMIDLTEVQKPFKKLLRQNPDAVMNGITCGPSQNQLWVTGKLWNSRILVEIK